MAPSKVSLKILIDKKGQRVLFAEAGKEFIDFLFSLLTLPIGTVIRLLKNKGMVGSLPKLYQSITDLKNDYMQSNKQKDLLLKPISSFSYVSPQLLLLPLEDCSSASPPPTSASSFYKCLMCTNPLLSPITRTCPDCRQSMSTVVSLYVPKPAPAPTPAAAAAAAAAGGFVKGVVTYMVMDDLVVSPMSTISSITLLNKFNIKELSALEEKVVEIGMDEGLEILKHAVGSNAVLTNVFLGSHGY